MQQRMNMKIKFRESFRPFAPIVLNEYVQEWFDIKTESPYMLIVAPVLEEKRKSDFINDPNEENLTKRLSVERSEVSSITHVDFSARIQTIDEGSAPRIKSILEQFYKITEVPVLINTSFNLRGEPIVCSPMDAYRCMMRSDIDHVLMENILVSRNKQPEWPENETWKKTIDLD